MMIKNAECDFTILTFPIHPFDQADAPRAVRETGFVRVLSKTYCECLNMEVILHHYHKGFFGLKTCKKTGGMATKRACHFGSAFPPLPVASKKGGLRDSVSQSTHTSWLFGG